MITMLLGHTKQINGVWKIQSLKQHSENVAEYCARRASRWGLKTWAVLQAGSMTLVNLIATCKNI